MQAAELKQRLRLENIHPEEIRDGAPIFVEGLGLDSIGALELAVLVEENFKVVIADEEDGKKALASIDALADSIMANQPAS